MKNLSSMVPVQYRPISIFTAFAMFLMAILVLTSCTNNHISDVTVIRKNTESPTFLDKASMVDELYYDAVTKSGDTLKVLVDEKISIKTPLPYQAKMRKNVHANFGFIEAENNKDL